VLLVYTKSTTYGPKVFVGGAAHAIPNEWHSLMRSRRRPLAVALPRCAKIAFVTRISTLLAPIDDCLFARVLMSTFVCKMSICLSNNHPHGTVGPCIVAR
jgi:hypothetical protein